MTSNSRKFACTVVGVLCLGSTGSALANSPHTEFHLLRSAVILGQAETDDQSVVTKSDVDRVLVQARNAIAKREFRKADALISQAERAKIRYPLFYRGDKPAKVRRVLKEAQAKSGGAQLPSQRFNPEASLDPSGAASSDPFLSRDGRNLPSSESGQPPKRISNASPIGQAIQLPSAEQSSLSRSSAFGRRIVVDSPDELAGRGGVENALLESSEPSQSRFPNKGSLISQGPVEPRRPSDAQLIEARRALAVGDIPQARANLENALRFQADYAPHEDSPAKVDLAIQKLEQVLEQRAGHESDPAWRRGYADTLVEQAEALRQWNALPEAEQLASDAARLGVAYQPHELSPRTVLERIAKQRQQPGTQGSHAREDELLRSVGASDQAVATPDTPPVDASLGRGASALEGAYDLPSESAARITQAPNRLAGNAGDSISLTNPASPQVDRRQDLLRRKQQALLLLQEAREALRQGNLDHADDLTKQVQALKLPNSLFENGEDSPWLLSIKIRNARASAKVVRTAEGQEPVSAGSAAAEATVFDSSLGGTSNVLATRGAPDGAVRRDPAVRAASNPPESHDIPITEGLPLRDQGAASGLGPKSAESPPSLLKETDAERDLLARKVSADVVNRLAESVDMREREPKKALDWLQETRKMVADSRVEPAVRAQLLRRVDRGIREMEKYIDDNRAQIELDEKNRSVLDDLDRRRQAKLDVDQRLHGLVDQFNKLRDEEKYEEMEVVARRALDLAPDQPVVRQLWQEARFIRRKMNNDDFRARKEDNVLDTFESVELAAMPRSDAVPFSLPDAQEWKELTRIRKSADRNNIRSPGELEIERKLKTPVMFKFENSPLSEVLDHIMQVSGVNIYVDQRGLAEEGADTNTPVSLKLTQEISLKSALNLMLAEHHLAYVIRDEVLKITSEEMLDEDAVVNTYNVADLVIPIPNFSPGSHTGLQGAISDAHAALNPVQNGFGGPMAVLASHSGNQGSGAINPQVLAQMQGAMGTQNNPTVPIGSGPGGLGGGVEPDFDQLIELITTTIKPESWDEVGGVGSVAPFETNLSLVISQTQDVHDQIADLLDQLRRLQDLQVTIEVRFITLSDSFFERIGLDFDFNIEDGLNNPDRIQPGSDTFSPSATVGLNPGGTFPAFTADLDIPFRQDNFLTAIPSFGGFDAASAGSFGFAILSDIEAFFLIQAAQGDRRSNVLQAPKVTLFNGQQAFVQDTAQTPFVISVIPVVGDFAAAQQPVIVVLSEGTSMSVQAVVSPDRRYVRLTVVPFFSQIGDVEEFTFEGSSTTTNGSSSSVDDDDDSIVNSSDDSTEIRQGTTVQLPTFAFVTVTTTVSVPDGGTVLLGGIKRLAEGRDEFGVPLLSKIPYVNRLFRNIGIGRETESLMMMVTPRIIIQEEEEERLLGVSSE